MTKVDDCSACPSQILISMGRKHDGDEKRILFTVLSDSAVGWDLSSPLLNIKIYCTSSIHHRYVIIIIKHNINRPRVICALFEIIIINRHRRTRDTSNI